MDVMVAPSNRLELNKKYTPKKNCEYGYEWVVPVLPMIRYGAVLCRVGNMGWVGSTMLTEENILSQYQIKPLSMENK